MLKNIDENNMVEVDFITNVKIVNLLELAKNHELYAKEKDQPWMQALENKNYLEFYLKDRTKPVRCSIIFKSKEEASYYASKIKNTELTYYDWLRSEKK